MFLCDQKFVLGQQSKNKRFYSLCIVYDEENTKEGKAQVDEFNSKAIIPHIFIYALESIVGFTLLE